MIKCKTVVVAAFNICKFYNLFKRLQLVNEITCKANATFAISILTAGK